MTDETIFKRETSDFWFVWTKRGRVPRYAHGSYKSALAEAERLAVIHPDRKFIVLKGVDKISVKPVIETAETH